MLIPCKIQCGSQALRGAENTSQQKTLTQVPAKLSEKDLLERERK